MKRFNFLHILLFSFLWLTLLSVNTGCHKNVTPIATPARDNNSINQPEGNIIIKTLPDCPGGNAFIYEIGTKTYSYDIDKTIDLSSKLAGKLSNKKDEVSSGNTDLSFNGVFGKDIVETLKASTNMSAEFIQRFNAAVQGYCNLRSLYPSNPTDLTSQDRKTIIKYLDKYYSSFLGLEDAEKKKKSE